MCSSDLRQIAQGVHLMAVKAEERIPDILSLAGIAAVGAEAAQPENNPKAPASALTG